MSAWEERANRELRALDRAYREGRIDRAGYRARRRDVFRALRVRDEITARNAIVPAARRGAAEGAGRDSASSILFAPRMPLPSRRLVLALLTGAVAIAFAILWFASVDAHVR